MTAPSVLTTQAARATSSAMTFDLAALGSSLGSAKTALEMVEKFGPRAAELGRKLVRDSFATLRASHISSGWQQVYPRLLGDVTWEMAAVSQLSLLNLVPEPADVEDVEATIDGGRGRAELWRPGLLLSRPPPEAKDQDAGRLTIGGRSHRTDITNRLVNVDDGFPLVFAPYGERRVMMAFLLDTRLAPGDVVVLRLRCRYRGQRLFRPIAGPLRFGMALQGDRWEYDPITGYPRWPASPNGVTTTIL